MSDMFDSHELGAEDMQEEPVRPANNQWRTKDGRIMNISDMEDSHLINAYRMLQRAGAVSKRTKLSYLTCRPPTSDTALDCFERDQIGMMKSPAIQQMDYMEEEAKKRGLKL